MSQWITPYNEKRGYIPICLYIWHHPAPVGTWYYVQIDRENAYSSPNRSQASTFYVHVCQDLRSYGWTVQEGVGWRAVAMLPAFSTTYPYFAEIYWRNRSVV